MGNRCTMVVCSLLFLTACNSSSGDDGARAAVVEKTSRPVVRSGDLAERGYTEADFPRVQRLADGVYSYESLKGNTGVDEERMNRGLPGVRFTVDNLIVVTSEGVLLADAQLSPEMTQRLVDKVAEITDKPITHLVIASRQYSQTGGNERLPKRLTVFAHPIAAAALKLENAELVRDKKVLYLGGREIEFCESNRASLPRRTNLDPSSHMLAAFLQASTTLS